MIKKVLVVALAATAALALETHTDGRQNAGERGVDCGWEAASPCNCFTDVTRTPLPPTLVNDDVNATAGSAETGIDGEDIRLVFKLDFSVFGQDDVLGGAQAQLSAGGHLLANATEWEPATQNVYKKPEIWFVNYAAGTDDRIAAATCPLGATITETKIYPAIYGSNGDDCGDFEISTEANLRDTLRECGWIKQPTLVQGTGPDAAQFYQVYDGKLKVQTDRHNGALRSAEVILRQEFPFWISIQYPTVVTVTSSNVSVIGAVVEQAALTHQIWDSAAGHVDLNAFVGVSYPYALADSEFADSVGAPGQDLQTRLVLNLSAGEGSCAKWVPVGGWKVGTDGVNYTCAGGAGDQTTAKYRAGVLCDRSAYGLVGQCDLADFFDLTGGEFGASTNDYEVQQSAGYKNLFANSGEIFDSPGSGLPTTNCSATNIGTANAKACKQNLHLRLTPRSGWCDLNVRLQLTQGVVCRDDAYGNDTHSHTWVPNGNAVAAVSGTTGRLLTPGGAVLPCSSLAAPDKEVGLIFSLASDDFCARVIETATLTSSLSVYQSEDTSANWGAHCADAAACTGTASSAAACGDGTTDPTEELCRQIPGLFPETSATTGLTAQQRQTQASFVFGTTSYLETRVFAPSGINIDTTTISELWVTKSDVATFPTASNEDRQDLLAGNWAKLLAQYSSGSYSALSLVSYKTGTSDAIGSRVAISNKISGTSTSGVDSLITGKADYFVDTTKANPAATGSDAAKLGKHFEGVSRASVLLDEYTVHITDPLEEAAESIKFWARITITYKAAADQETLGADEVTTQAEAPAGSSSRARLAAAPALTGRSVSAQAGVTPAGTSGAAGGSSTIAGVSATTVVAATVVVGAVVVAAGVGLFVARRRRTAQRATKRTSSTQELNDTAQVQV